MRWGEVAYSRDWLLPFLRSVAVRTRSNAWISASGTNTCHKNHLRGMRSPAASKCRNLRYERQSPAISSIERSGKRRSPRVLSSGRGPGLIRKTTSRLRLMMTCKTASGKRQAPRLAGGADRLRQTLLSGPIARVVWRSLFMIFACVRFRAAIRLEWRWQLVCQNFSWAAGHA